VFGPPINIDVVEDHNLILSGALCRCAVLDKKSMVFKFETEFTTVHQAKL
jgi:hypothetical protein